MRQAERHDVRRARVHLKAGDVRTALRILISLDAPPPPLPEPTDPGQLMLAGFELAFPFYCQRLDGTFTVKGCLTRRSRVWPSGGGKGSPAPGATACIGCPVGASFAARLPEFVPPPSTLAAEVLSPTQRMAKRARALAGLWPDDPVNLNPLNIASSMTRDDDGVDYTP